MGTSGIILAGGKSSRLGRNKILETVGQRSLLQQVLERLNPLCDDIIIVTSQERAALPLNPRPGLRITKDIFPGRGPLGGIYTGLSSSASLFNIVVAGDLPFLNRELLQYMIQLAPGYDLVVPRMGNKIEPLHAVYARSCINPIKTMLEQNRLSVNELSESVKTRYVEADEIDRFDPGHLSFFNINTEADLEKAREIVGKDDK